MAVSCWSLSVFRAGQLVEVRSREEILATLDDQGSYEGIPFMPEMLAYCGQQYRVSAVAHKACETAKKTWRSRRLSKTVHLENLRCDGSAHGGCQAECNLFWKDAWLKPIGRRDKTKASPDRQCCTEHQLFQLTVASDSHKDERPTYSCQATKLYDATAPLSPWDSRQYFRDWWTGNHTFGHVAGVLWISFLETWHVRTPIGYRWLKSCLERVHRRVTGRTRVPIQPSVPAGQRTPSIDLGLQAGEYVRVRSVAEIEATLSESSHNRGLSFDYEMAAFCGRVLRVKKVVTEILDEGTGQMMHMKQPCIMLEGAYCGGEYSACRLLCPRAIPPYWREIWLERVPAPIDASQQHNDTTDNSLEQHVVT